MPPAACALPPALAALLRRGIATAVAAQLLLWRPPALLFVWRLWRGPPTRRYVVGTVVLQLYGCTSSLSISSALHGAWRMMEIPRRQVN
jgi:hypothetical protein